MKLCFIPPFLFLAAAAVAAWLAWLSLFGGGLAGCSGDGNDCSTVLLSHWSRVFGVPVALIGGLLYLGVALAVWRQWTRLVLFGAVTILASAAWFFIIQLFILHAWCWRCGLAHALAGVGAVLSLSMLLKKRRSLQNSAPSARGFWVLGGAVAVSVFALMQVVFPSEQTTHRFIAADAESREASFLTFNPDGRISVALPVGGERLIYSTRFPILGDMGEAGNSVLRKPVILLSDWTCAHCRELHKRCQTFIRGGALAEKVSFIILPAWRDTQALEIHRLMLAAWLEDRAAYLQVVSSLLEGSLTAEAAGIQGKLEERFGKDAWFAIRQKHEGEIGVILAAGALVLAANDARSEVSTLPQLRSNAGLIQGLPSKGALVDFVRKSADAAFEAAPSQVMSGEGSFGNGNPRINGMSPPTPLVTKTKAAFVWLQSEPVLSGPVVAGKSAKGTVAFRNVGSEPLTILGVVSSCGCTVVDDWRQTVAPGAVGRIHFTFDAKTIPPGSYQKSIGIRSDASNAPTDGLVQLAFSAEVVATAAPLPGVNPLVTH